MRRISARLQIIPIVALALTPALTGCNKIQARVELKKGNAFYMDETYRQALEQFQKGLELDPGATFAWRSVGLSAMALYRPDVDTEENRKYADTAVDAFKKYLAYYPNDEKVEEYLITTLINAERYDEALRPSQAGRAEEPQQAGHAAGDHHHARQGRPAGRGLSSGRTRTAPRTRRSTTASPSPAGTSRTTIRRSTPWPAARWWTPASRRRRKR